MIWSRWNFMIIFDYKFSFLNLFNYFHCRGLNAFSKFQIIISSHFKYLVNLQFILFRVGVMILLPIFVFVIIIKLYQDHNY